MAEAEGHVTLAELQAAGFNVHLHEPNRLEITRAGVGTAPSWFPPPLPDLLSRQPRCRRPRSRPRRLLPLSLAPTTASSRVAPRGRLVREAWRRNARARLRCALTRTCSAADKGGADRHPNAGIGERTRRSARREAMPDNAGHIRLDEIKKTGLSPASATTCSNSASPQGAPTPSPRVSPSPYRRASIRRIAQSV